MSTFAIQNHRGSVSQVPSLCLQRPTELHKMTFVTTGFTLVSLEAADGHDELLPSAVFL